MNIYDRQENLGLLLKDLEKALNETESYYHYPIVSYPLLLDTVEFLKKLKDESEAKDV